MIQFSPEEKQELAKIANLSDTELASFKRQITADEGRIFDQTVLELFEQGFVVSLDNVRKLYSAFDSSPNVAITKANIFETTKVYRESFAWKTPEETEYQKLSAELGEAGTAQVHKLLSNYGLYSQGEEGMKNFNLVVSYAKAQGWPITATSYNLIERLRNTPKGTGLEFRPTPDQIRRRKELDETRTSTPPQKSALELAKAKADAVKHAVNPETGRKYADEIMEEYYTKYGSGESPASAPPADDSVNPENSYWQRRTLDFIGSAQIRNNQRAELLNKFGKAPMGGNWKLNYLQLESYIQKQKDEASIQRQLESDRAKMGIRG